MLLIYLELAVSIHAAPRAHEPISITPTSTFTPIFYLPPKEFNENTLALIENSMDYLDDCLPFGYSRPTMTLGQNSASQVTDFTISTLVSEYFTPTITAAIPIQTPVALATPSPVRPFISKTTTSSFMIASSPFTSTISSTTPASITKTVSKSKSMNCILGWRKYSKCDWP